MATFHHRVERYRVVLWRNGEEAALIYCIGHQRDTGLPVLLTVEFYQDGAVLQSNESSPDGLSGFLRTHAANYAAFVDLLRNESPVTAVIDTDEPHRNRLTTAAEPAGEGE